MTAPSPISGASDADRSPETADAVVDSAVRAAGPNPADYTQMSSGEFNDAMTDDGMKWAEAFCQFYPDAPDVETMFGWFANAIERSGDYRRWQLVKNDQAFIDFISDIARDRALMADIAAMPADLAETAVS